MESIESIQKSLNEIRDRLRPNDAQHRLFLLSRTRNVDVEQEIVARDGFYELTCRERGNVASRLLFKNSELVLYYMTREAVIQMAKEQDPEIYLGPRTSETREKTASAEIDLMEQANPAWKIKFAQELVDNLGVTLRP